MKSYCITFSALKLAFFQTSIIMMMKVQVKSEK